ncbi:SpaA isopeptide-forming pilin-related protein [Bifidobacterium sp. SO1]|uniref:SpaA isopeptide-forming pilin-related protein n=1 Tax=Bifidobacterium sp. SO1 TaxID=2809029 RepID=UPI001BDD893E|nr:SpaA isopeptide-forming pilin-related protein [Bifidobacterium sp. SO1]MBT1162250.1 isopeptide-forming domain-containing fimbrial protein [Bifidobacterium sp. SO1]
MKKLGKAILGLVAAVAMLVTGLVAPLTAVAAGEYHITIGTDAKPVTSEHTFQAYQVFKGDLSKDETTLSNIDWGTGVIGSELLTALKSDAEFGTTFADVTTAAQAAGKMDAQFDAAAFAKIVAKYLDQTSGNGSFKNGKYTISGLDAGYYLIKDKDNTLGNKTEAYTEFILKVVKNIDGVAAKADVPTVEKKVKDTNDSETVANDPNDDQWSDSADHDIYDLVDYKLTGTLPSNYASYTEGYTYKFTDTLSKGLTVQDGKNDKEVKHSTAVKSENSIHVYAVNPDAAGSYTSENATKVEIADATNAQDKTTGYEVSVKSYDKNGTEVETSDSDYWTKVDHHVMTINFANLKNVTKSASDTSDTALTIDAKTQIVVEYKAQLNTHATVGETGNPNEVKLTFSNNPNHEGEGTPTGDTPEDKVTVFTFELNATKVDSAGNEKIGATFSLYKWNKNSSQYDLVDTIAGTGSSKFTFSGLDAGQYKLVEDQAPDTYNKMPDKEFKIVAVHNATSDDPKLTSLKFTDLNGTEIPSTDEYFQVQTTTDAGKPNVNIVNYKGSELPSTGGMGTVILYALGAAFVAAAGAWFAFRRRLSNC